MMRTAGLCLLGILFALGTLHTKIIGAAWLGFCIWGFWTGFKTRGIAVDKAAPGPASAWLGSCIVALLLAIVCVLIWSEEPDILNPQVRLLLPAIAVWILVRRGSLSVSIRTGMAHALAAGCIVAFAWAAFWMMRDAANIRNLLASNAIPWAVAVSFSACLLLPMALTERASVLRRRIWLAGSICGIAAVLLSQSRGAFLVIPWCGLVYAWFWHHEKYHSRVGFHRTLLALSCAVTMLVAFAWWSPGDKLRMHQAVQNIDQFQTAQNYNTSAGVRLYLWDMAWQGIRQSPWIGIGSVERMRRIQHVGDGETAKARLKLSVVRQVGHVHNQYLNAALDGGMIGLAAFLVLLVGMAIATRRLARTDTVAAWQLGGVLFMHATASLTNVNFLHNYYVVALSLAAVVPLLGARCVSPAVRDTPCIS